MKAKGSDRGEGRTKLLVALAAISAFVVLLVCSLTAFGVIAARNVPDAVKEACVMRIELADSVPAAEAKSLEELLRSKAEVSSASYLPRAARCDSSALADTQGLTAHNPLPDLLLLSFASSFVTPDNLKRLQAEAAADPRVRAATYAPDMAEVSAGLLPMVGMAAWALLACVCLLSFFAVWHGARMVRRIRDEYEAGVDATGLNRHMHPSYYYAVAIIGALTVTALVVFNPPFTSALFGLQSVRAAKFAALLSALAVGVPAVLFGLGVGRKKRVAKANDSVETGADGFAEDV